jgi:hypothetical protein
LANCTGVAVSALSTATGAAPSYSCRAWVNFNGTGTVAIRASGNVSSITDVGVGVYTVNFTTSLVDANYCMNVSASNDGTDTSTANKITGTPSTSSFGVQHIENNAAADSSRMLVAVFR